MSRFPTFINIHGLFQQLKTKSFHDDLIFFLAVVVAGSLIFNLAAFLTRISTVPESSISDLQILGNVFLVLGIGIIQGLFGGVILLLGTSLIEHFFLLLVDVRNNFEMTVKSVTYAVAPAVLFYWLIAIAKILVFDLMLLVWFGVATYFGTSIFHGITVDRAVFVSIATSAVLLFLSYGWLVRSGFLAG